MYVSVPACMQWCAYTVCTWMVFGPPLCHSPATCQLIFPIYKNTSFEITLLVAAWRVSRRNWTMMYGVRPRPVHMYSVVCRCVRCRGRQDYSYSVGKAGERGWSLCPVPESRVLLASIDAIRSTTLTAHYSLTTYTPTPHLGVLCSLSALWSPVDDPALVINNREC